MSATPIGDLDGTPAEVYERILVPRVFMPLAQAMVELGRPAEGERVLDLACGTGALTRLLAANVGLTGSVVGLEVNPEMLGLAATHASGPQVDWREASALDLPFADSMFDLVTRQQGLQFFPDRPVHWGRCAVSCDPAAAWWCRAGGHPRKLPVTRRSNAR